MIAANATANSSTNLRYCWAGTHKVASRAVSALEGRDLTAFVVSFASAMRQLECKSGVSGVSPRFPRFPTSLSFLQKMLPNKLNRSDELWLVACVAKRSKVGEQTWGYDTFMCGLDFLPLDLR